MRKPTSDADLPPVVMPSCEVRKILAGQKALVSRASDLWHWQVNVTTAEAGAAADMLRDAHTSFISPDPIDVPDEEASFDEGLMARDPDGRALMLRRP